MSEVSKSHGGGPPHPQLCLFPPGTGLLARFHTEGGNPTCEVVKADALVEHLILQSSCFVLGNHKLVVVKVITN